MAKKVVEKKTSAKKTTAEKASVKKVAKPVEKVATKKSASATKPIKANDSTKKVVAKSKVAAVKSIEKLITKKAEAPAATVKADKKTVVETKPLPQIVNSGTSKPVKSILISQPKPELGKSPYIDLAEQFKIKLDWRPFTHVEGVKAADFRKDKVYIEQYPCVIFTSRIAIEQYFRICEELRIKINEDNRYFCHSEAIALYLQKFINYRKRKVFFGDGKLPKLMELIVKHKDGGKFLLPCSDVRDKALAEALVKQQITYSEAIIYKTVASDLSDLSDVKYDMLVFFNPSAIDSLYTNFPKFKQDETRLAIFGNSTADTVKAHKLNINVFAPTPENPSLVDAIKKYIIEANKKGK
jgi:uroporphyrinogen-III synthase